MILNDKNVTNKLITIIFLPKICTILTWKTRTVTHVDLTTKFLQFLALNLKILTWKTKILTLKNQNVEKIDYIWQVQKICLPY